MEKIRTELIVLSEQKYGESSKIIRVFSKEKGKITILAKGALNAKSPLVSITQLFSHSNAYINKGRSFYYIESATILNSNFKIRKKYETLIISSYILELLDKTFLEGEVNKKIFDLTVKTLKIIQNINYIMPIILAFELKYITFLGYRPSLELQEKNNYFSIKDGGIVDLDENQFGCYLLDKKDIYYLKKIIIYFFR